MHKGLWARHTHPGRIFYKTTKLKYSEAIQIIVSCKLADGGNNMNFLDTDKSTLPRHRQKQSCCDLLWILWLLDHGKITRGATLVIEIWSWGGVSRRRWGHTQRTLTSSVPLGRPLPGSGALCPRTKLVFTFALPRWGRTVILYEGRILLLTT